MMGICLSSRSALISWGEATISPHCSLDTMICGGMFDTSRSAISCFEGVAGDASSRGRIVCSCSICIAGSSKLPLLIRPVPEEMPAVAHGCLGVDGCSAPLLSPTLLTPARPSFVIDCGLTVLGFARASSLLHKSVIRELAGNLAPGIHVKHVHVTA